MTCSGIYIYRPKYYRINGKCAYHSKLPRNNRKHNQFQLLYGNCTKQRGVSSVLFELVSIITIYLGGSNCAKICK